MLCGSHPPPQTQSREDRVSLFFCVDLGATLKLAIKEDNHRKWMVISADWLSWLQPSHRKVFSQTGACKHIPTSAVPVHHTVKSLFPTNNASHESKQKYCTSVSRSLLKAVSRFPLVKIFNKFCTSRDSLQRLQHSGQQNTCFLFHRFSFWHQEQLLSESIRISNLNCIILNAHKPIQYIRILLAMKWIYFSNYQQLKHIIWIN